MKRKLILWLGVCLPLAALAQTTPKRGYIQDTNNKTTDIFKYHYQNQ